MLQHCMLHHTRRRRRFSPCSSPLSVSLSLSLALFQLHVCMICCIFPDLAHHFAIGKIGLFQYLSTCHEWWNLIDTSMCVVFTSQYFTCRPFEALPIAARSPQRSHRCRTSSPGVQVVGIFGPIWADVVTTVELVEKQ